jgi:hypothetical protein
MITVNTKRFTLDEYHRLGELGFFAPDERVELIRGEMKFNKNKRKNHNEFSLHYRYSMVG